MACSDQKLSTVRGHFRSTFERYGIPDAIYVDNGNPWGTKGMGIGQTKLTAWLMRHDIEVIHGRPYHPQGRGKLERFHRTLKREVLQDRQFVRMPQVQESFDGWRDVYNRQRPHEALGLETPISRYRASERSFQAKLCAYEYSDRFEVRHTNPHGQIRFEGKGYKISEAFDWPGVYR